MTLENSVVLITGANRGIGRALAEECLKAGARKIYLGVRMPSKGAAFEGWNVSKCLPLRLDVTCARDIRSAAAEASDVSILINNAGVLYQDKLLEAEALDHAREEMEVNYFGPFALTRAFAPVIAGNGGGVVVNICSIAGLVALPGAPTYSISKAALHFLTLESRMELRELGIRVLGVYPGPVDTEMAGTSELEKISPEEVAAKTVAAIMSGKETLFPDPVIKDIHSLLHLQPGSDKTIMAAPSYQAAQAAA